MMRCMDYACWLGSFVAAELRNFAMRNSSHHANEPVFIYLSPRSVLPRSIVIVYFILLGF